MTEAKVRQQYDRVAAVYDQRWSRYVTNTLQFLNAWADFSPTDRVLDIACGTGEFERIVLLAHPTQEIVGVDFSESMVAIAQKKACTFPQVSFQVATASALPFADHQFDMVICANAFHYFDDPIVALMEMQRVLKPTGKVVILDWCRDFFLCRVCDVVLKLFDPAHQRCYTEGEFHDLLTSAGFEVVRSRRIRFGWLWGLMVATATHG
jgi:ubiquinone/menaquinone biosynthesis C-methylase UbiE